MKKWTVATVVAASVAGGIILGVAGSAVMSGTSSTASPPRTTHAAAPVPELEAKQPRFVMNDDGTATLSATLVNHTKNPLEITWAAAGQPDDLDAPVLLLYAARPTVALKPGEPTRISGPGDDYRIRFSDRVQVGSTLPVTLQSRRHDGIQSGPNATFGAPVVARTTADGDVVNNGPNPDITVHEAKFVVVPGQKKAYASGWITSTVDDFTSLRPTAVTSQGADIEYLHQTATGGPSGVGAQAGKKTYLGQAPYTDDGARGDRDYVRASDVEVGQTIIVTMRFPSGDVVTKFTVVQGKADGTIQPPTPSRRWITASSAAG
ncbi:hypothetical protein [Aeromicrobium chenweiae]|uniref:Uncharacterized protein n=1 Tax=Aeromicrobium chenweiae TaxID=2079793 RepID=A0A2S0WLT3_9ACTN|nr:hypothetical protein [Aeromicrobium chenweiae]AWB92285.1 hypothetical protein C3E78_08775 [Aeromicrobium chenweiae]TGN31431.1 hypothetical protein E4L97_13795 [Aeromicrobium chenweiae]